MPIILANQRLVCIFATSIMRLTIFKRVLANLKQWFPKTALISTENLKYNSREREGNQNLIRKLAYISYLHLHY